MELRHLRYFVTVAETENVTRAAARLHVSQPPLTRQIRDLEGELGVALFERSGKSIRLTPSGRVFLGEARAALERVDRAIEAVRAAARDELGDLHLGYAPSPTVEVLPKVLRAMHRAKPRIRVILHDHSTPEMLAGLRERRLQAALMMQPPGAASRGITFEPLRTYAVGVLMAPHHVLANRRRLTVAEVVGEPWVVFARKEYPDYHAFLGRVLKEGMRRLRVVEECDGGPSLMAAVGAGRGLAITPSVVAQAAGRRLRFVPLDPPPAPAVVGLAFLAKPSSTLVRSLVDTVRLALRD